MKRLIEVLLNWLSARVVVVAVMCSPAGAQEVTQEWVARYSGPGGDYDEPFAIALDQYGNIYVTGYGAVLDSLGSINCDYATIRYNPNGSTTFPGWVSYYGGLGIHGSMAVSLVINTIPINPEIYVTGTSAAEWPDIFDYATLRYSSSGYLLDEHRYNGTGNGDDHATSMAITIVGGWLTHIAVTGYSDGDTSAQTNYDYATIKYYSGLSPQYTWRYSGPGNGEDVATAIAMDPSSYIYVTGRSQGEGSDYDYATIKYGTGGSELWVARYDGPSHTDDFANAIAVDSAGNVYVTGESCWDYATIKYNTGGTEQWVNRYHYYDVDVATAICVDYEGSVYVTGNSHGDIGMALNYDIATVKYNSNGVQVWSARYDGGVPIWGGDDIARAIKVDSVGNVYVTGYRYVSGEANYDYVTIKYNPNGVEEWIATYDYGGGEDYTHALTMDENGNVFITGSSSYDYATIKYSQSVPVVTLTLTPVNPPIQIPASGGSFNFNANLTNNQTTPTTFDVWIMVQLPNGNWWGPALGPINLTLPGSASLTRLRTQSVPGPAPAGTYLYEGRVGVYPDSIWDTGSFLFEKLGVGEGESIKEWGNAGEDFPEWSAAKVQSETPNEYELYAIYPNPFNPSTIIRFALLEAAQVKLTIYDLTGKAVTLVDGWREEGEHQVTFDGSALPSGVYLYRLEAGEQVAGGKMVLLK